MDASHQSAVLQEAKKLATILSGIWGADRYYRFLSYALKWIGRETMHAKASINEFAGYELAKKKSPSDTAIGIAKLGGAISSGRYILRFWGVLDSAIALCDNPHRQTDLNASIIHDTQAALMLVYHLLEHTAWIGFVAPELVTSKTANKMSRLSCVVWLLWIVIEAVRLYRTNSDCFSTALSQSKAECKRRRRVQFTAMKLLCDFIMAATWSFPNVITTSERTMYLCGVVGAVLPAYLQWKDA